MLNPYRIVKDVESTAETIKEVEVDVDTTFINKGISKLYDKENNHIGYKIAVQEWWKNEEYIEKISKENKDLKLELNTSNMELLTTLQELNIQNQVTQAQLMMEVAKTIEGLKGGE